MTDKITVVSSAVACAQKVPRVTWLFAFEVGVGMVRVRA